MDADIKELAQLMFEIHGGDAANEATRQANMAGSLGNAADCDKWERLAVVIRQVLADTKQVSQ
jgi:hypothetical protein